MDKLGKVLFSTLGILPLLTANYIPLFGQSVDWQRVEAHTAKVVKEKLPNTYIHPRWVDGTPFMYYHIQQPKHTVHYLVNAGTGKQELLIKNIEDFAHRYSALTKDTLNLPDFRLYNVLPLDKKFSKVLIKYDGKVLEYDRRSGELSLSHREFPPKKFESNRTTNFTPTTTDKNLSMIQLGNQLLMKRVDLGDTIRVDGWESDRATLTTSAPAKARPARGFWCGDKYLQLVVLEEDGEEMGLIQSVGKGRPKVETFQMPMPGEQNAPQYSLFYYDRNAGKGQYLDIDKYQDQEVNLSPYRSEHTLYFTRTSRPKDRVELCKVNLENGEVKAIISEKTEPIYNLVLFNYRILDDKILWWSERDGYGKYYLYDTEGQLLHQLINDPTLVCGRIVQMRDSDFIMEGYGGKDASNPYYRRYFRVPLNGSGERSIVGSEGEYELTVSDDKAYGLVKCSRMDLPPIYSIMQLNPRISAPREIFRVTEEEALNAGWVKPKLISLSARDGKTDLHGIMYLPSTLDPTSKYPVISYVYPGPQTDLMPLDFTLDENANQSLAELGFVVVQIPSRGSSPYRGKAFYTYGHGNLRDYPLEDNKYAVEQLSTMYPFIDLGKVGIYGHSGGGFHALTSMLTYPDFYKACLAASGNYDNNIYIRWWGESFHGVKPVQQEDGSIVFESEIPTTMELADRLNGPLLLITGDEDKNVPPSSTIRMANALIEAGKDFDMLIMPGKSHELDSPYYFNKIKYFFLKNLLGIDEGHTDIIHHK